MLVSAAIPDLVPVPVEGEGEGQGQGLRTRVKGPTLIPTLPEKAAAAATDATPATIDTPRPRVSATSKAATTLLTRAQVAERVAQGQTLVILHHQVYDLTKWATSHPGGALPLLRMAGKDATDAVIAFHSARVIQERMGHFCIATLADPLPTPPIALAFRALEGRLHREGYYRTDYGFYARELVRYALFWVGMLYTTVYLGPQHSGFYVLGALLGAALWHQAAFFGHDSGHNAISHDQRTDFLVGSFVASAMGGLSLGWWKSNHNVHHLVTNDPEHDPDIQHLPFFAVTTAFFKSIHSSYYGATLHFDRWAQRIIPYQHYLYYVVLAFGRFNLYAQSWIYLLSPGKGGGKVPYRAWELGGLVLFWVWYSALLRTLPGWGWRAFYLLLSHAATVFLHLQITLSHFGMDTEVPAVERAGGQEDFTTKALRTSMDVECPRWMDWFHGGLQVGLLALHGPAHLLPTPIPRIDTLASTLARPNTRTPPPPRTQYQVGHHLFPRLPRHNLRAITPFVRQLAQDHGLAYHAYGFRAGNRKVLGVLKHVADQVGVVFMVDPSKVHVY
jgi:fatty acid desaturase